MIESIFSPKTVEKKPWEAFIAGIVFTAVAFLVVVQIGSPSPCQGSGLGLLLTGFITIAATPFFLNVFRIEEEKEEKSEGNIFTRHREVIEIFAFFFFAIVVMSSLIYVLIPEAGSRQIYADQIHDLCARGIISDPICIKAQISGAAQGQTAGSGVQGGSQPAGQFSVGGVSGAAVSRTDFLGIATNNLKVLAIAFFFSLIFGAGAVFLIVWNAGILGVLIGKIAENPAAYASPIVVQGNVLANYVIALPLTIIKIMPHGMFEFLGYFLAAVAGGILSIAIIREKFLKRKERVIQDCLVYLGLAVLCIIIGAVIESAV